jgi:hypothetical protein
LFSDFPSGVKPVHYRHHHIHNDADETLIVGHFNRFSTIVRKNNRHLQLGQHVLQDAAVGVIVFRY